jgi:signal transduction histidine kinase
MSQKYAKSKIGFTAMLVVVISFLHYFTSMQLIYYHIFYRELYFLPLILAGFWFGLKGGIIASLSVTVLYLPVVMMHWQSFSADDFDKILEILLFNIVAAGLGFISDREKSHENAMIEAERRAREQAESANRLKSDFLSVMSHELRTPLVSIIGYNDLLIDGVAGSLTEEQVDALKRIDKNSKNLLELINSMLDLSRLEAEQLSLEVKEFHASELIEEIRSKSLGSYEKSGLNFIWKVEPDLPLLHSDPTKLKVILKNLIDNAVKFTEKGSVTIDVRSRDGGIEFSVIDTGIGIPLEMLPVIFESFRQLEGPLTRRHGGIGLGLYITKKLLELLSGSINVESEAGKGSTFHAWIPTGEGMDYKRKT